MYIYSKIFNRYAIVLLSLESIEKIKSHKWNIHTNGYICSRMNKKVILLHRFLFEDSEGHQIDHINRDKFDNRLENLRLVNCSLNQINKYIMSNNTSGVTGVTWDKSRNKWKVSLNINKKCYNLGRYNSFEEACFIRFEAEKIYHKEYSPRKDKDKNWLKDKINKILNNINLTEPKSI